MTNIEKIITEEIDSLKEEALLLRHWFHMHPELPCEEFETANKIEEYLRDLGLQVKRVDNTGVYTEIDSGKAGKTIILRADTDGLPVKEENDVEYKSQNEGKMHACGHDSHITSLLIASKILSKHKNDFKGKVKICFQHAEEIGHGARQFVEAGLVKGDRTFGAHSMSDLDAGKVLIAKGPNNAAVDWFKITVNGIGAHVSTPEKGADALYVASQIVIALQSIKTRLVNPMEPLLIGVGKLVSGEAYNVVAKDALIEGTIRSLNEEVRAFAKKKIEEISNSIASIYGASVTIWFRDNTSALINDEKSSLEVESVAKRIFGDNKVINSRTPALGGDDMADFIRKVPGCYAFFGTRNEKNPSTCQAHHNSKFDIDDKGVLVSAKLYSCYAIDFLNDTIN